MKIPPPTGNLVDIGGYSLHYHLTGKGKPSVIFESGGGGWSLDWTPVQSQVSKFTTAFSYDRAGLGWSQSGLKPRTSEQMVKELHTLLTLANIEKPYIMVGASYGGHIVRLYAHHHREDVAGMVLLDARHEDIDNRMPPAWSQQLRMGATIYGFMLLVSRLKLMPVIGKLMGDKTIPPAIKKLPYELQQMYLALAAQPKYWETNLAEYKASTVSDQQIQVSHTLDNIPLVVIRHGLPEMFSQMPAKQAEQAEEVWQTLQLELSRLSNNSQLLIAANSGHNISIDEPELVVESIHKVIDN